MYALCIYSILLLLLLLLFTLFILFLIPFRVHWPKVKSRKARNGYWSGRLRQQRYCALIVAICAS